MKLKDYNKLYTAAISLESAPLMFPSEYTALFDAEKDKIDKKELAFNVMREVFGASEEDCLIIGKNIEYLHTNKIIKKVSYYKLFKATFAEFFKKK
jgi:hypothetical protein